MFGCARPHQPNRGLLRALQARPALGLRRSDELEVHPTVLLALGYVPGRAGALTSPSDGWILAPPSHGCTTEDRACRCEAISSASQQPRSRGMGREGDCDRAGLTRRALGLSLKRSRLRDVGTSKAVVSGGAPARVHLSGGSRRAPLTRWRNHDCLLLAQTRAAATGCVRRANKLSYAPVCMRD